MSSRRLLVSNAGILSVSSSAHLDRSLRGEAKIGWRVAVLAVALMASGPERASAKELRPVQDALKQVFPPPMVVTSRRVVLSSNHVAQLKAANGLRHIPATLQYHTASTNGAVTGYAVVHTVFGKHGPIKLMVATDHRLVVTHTEILWFREQRGRPVRRQAFLSQFLGKTVEGGSTARWKINAITGATISSRAVARGVKEALTCLGVVIAEGD